MALMIADTILGMLLAPNFALGSPCHTFITLFNY